MTSRIAILISATLLVAGSVLALEADEKCQALKNKDTGKLAEECADPCRPSGPPGMPSHQQRLHRHAHTTQRCSPSAAAAKDIINAVDHFTDVDVRRFAGKLDRAVSRRRDRDPGRRPRLLARWHDTVVDDTGTFQLDIDLDLGLGHLEIKQTD